MDLWREGQTEELNWIYHVHSRWLIQFDHRNGIQLFHSGMVERTLPRNVSILYVYIFSILIIIREPGHFICKTIRYRIYWSEYSSTKDNTRSSSFFNDRKIFSIASIKFHNAPIPPLDEVNRNYFQLLTFVKSHPFRWNQRARPIQYVTRPLHAN